MKVLLLAAALGSAWAQTPAPAPDVDEIMSRVGANQTRSQDARREWVYNQKLFVRMLRTNGKLAREERREYVITPKNRRVHKELVKFEGKAEDHGKITPYDHPGYSFKGVDIDGEVIDDLSEDLTYDKESRDGLSRDLFPLIPAEQKHYDFKLEAAETYRGRPVFRVSFAPKKHLPDGESGDWKGEALIDAEDSEPVLVTTRLAAAIPMAVKILLGTNVKGLGFSLTYQKFADGIWFPVSYGGEFEVRAIFFYKRTITISLTNSDFRRADVSSNIAYNIEDK
ncbi:MAG TPA: hypothetical protein VMH81_21575 [Bryobacteraceae bacterium]|nr:hypothetical protein [Bryobacteraceae bacterium]